jgi:spore germination protein GerM
LKSEQRVMLQPPDTVSFARAIIEALIKGPQKGLLQTLPNGTALHALYITPDNVCYVDFSEAIRTNHPGGSNSELLTIYSVVNSLILNIPRIERVKILIDGNETSTLAGHIDLQYPVKAHMLIVR